MSPRRALVWVAAGALVVLVGRTIAYAALPSPTAELLAGKAGGPALPLVAVVALGLGASLAVAVCWLAALGVRERALLERRLLTAPPPELRPGRVLARALALWALAAPAAGLLEAWIHWRAGLGWHGLHCLVGPVHRDLIPIVGGLSLVAAAVLSAVDHALAWMRRTFALLRGVQARLAPAPTVTDPIESFATRARFRAARAGARAPPPVA
jgi:hypothetical protein